MMSALGVSTNPGHMAFTVIPFGPSSRASELVNPAIPCLVETYGEKFGSPTDDTNAIDKLLKERDEELKAL